MLADAEQRIQRIAHRQRPDGTWELYATDASDITGEAPHDCQDIDNWFPTGECDPITSVMPDYEGRIWWVTRFGRVGTLTPATGQVAVHRFAGEEIQNSLSADVNWGSPAIATDGTVYLGILEGILAIRDAPTGGG